MMFIESNSFFAFYYHKSKHNLIQKYSPSEEKLRRYCYYVNAIKNHVMQFI
jgi:hypothetical protein